MEDKKSLFQASSYHIYHTANVIPEWSDGGIFSPSFLMSGAMERTGKNPKEWSGKWSSLQKYWSVHNHEIKVYQSHQIKAKSGLAQRDLGILQKTELSYINRNRTMLLHHGTELQQ